MTTLAQITRGQAARVERVDGEDQTSLRLLEMGLTPGCEVQYLGECRWGTRWSFCCEAIALACDGAKPHESR